MSFLDSLRGPYDCQKCFNDVRELGTPVVEVNKKHWHSHCFVCKVCNENVRDEYYHMDDMLLCPEHWEIRTGGFCQVCFGQLNTAKSVTTPKGKFHVNCLQCIICSGAFSAGSSAVPYGTKGFLHPHCLVCAVCTADAGQMVVDTTRSPPLVRCRQCRDDKRQVPQDEEDYPGLETHEEQVDEPEQMQGMSSFAVPAEASSPLRPATSGTRVQDPVPHIVQRCVDHLMQPEALQEEGLFRVPGKSDVVHRLNEEFNRNGDASFEDASYHDVAGLLKMAFRRPLYNREAALAIGNAVDMIPADLEGAKEELEGVDNYKALGLLIELFSKVNDEPSNKMTVFSISTSLGVSLFASLNIKRTQEVLKCLIEHRHSVFDIPVTQSPSKAGMAVF